MPRISRIGRNLGKRCALLALPLMLWPRTKRTPFPKVAAYAAYPGHLLILWGIQLALGITTLQDSLRLLIP